MNEKKLTISSAPHITTTENVEKIMFAVVYSLIPAGMAAVYFFGPRALALMLVCVGCSIGTEYVFQRARAKSISAFDGSAVITGLLLAYTLPPGLPLYMAAFGSIAAIAIGKQIFGGLGQNIFNPALVGRAIIQATFPIAMASWTGPMRWLMGSADTISSATPLGLMKFDLKGTSILDLFFGNTAGSLGETSALALLAGAAFLFYKGYIEWRIPAGFIGSVAVFSGIMWFIDANRYPDPLFSVFAGGLILGAFFMATDYVTSPLTAKGKLIFGIGGGILIVVIRFWGGLQEGVMYAILLMNALTPIINRYTKPSVFGSA